MAITNARMQIKRGNEVDFDAEKMLVGEWALSTDKRIVRICVAPNTCIRMATYDAFEVDMAKVEKILEECQSIEDAVELINSQVSDKLDATIEYTNQAKQYRDEAKTFRDEAEAFAPDGYDELKETVASNTVKIDTIIEKAELNIKNTASGENLHLTDSADSKAVSFNLYGKAEQKQYSGKNVLENTATTQTVNGITFTVNRDGSVTASGTATANARFDIYPGIPLKPERYTATCGNKTADDEFRLSITRDGNTTYYSAPTTFSVVENDIIQPYLVILSGKTVNATFYPMIRLASITDDTYEPYVGGIASPNPDYPQEIAVSGSDGSVEVVSCGKNFWNPSSKTTNENGVERTGITVPSGTYTISNNSDGDVFVRDGLASKDTITIKTKTVQTFTFFLDGFIWIPPATIAISDIQVEHGTVATEYQPYTETLSTIPTPDGLCGIKVSSGGNYTDENGQQWIADEIVKYADGSGKRIQRIGKALFDGSEDEGWAINELNANTTRCVIEQPISIKEGIMAISNLFTYLDGYNASIGAIDYCCFAIRGLLNGFTLRVPSTITTASELRAFLADNPVEIYYALSEPIITDLTAEEIAEIEKLHTFYPVTNISNDADCGMSITYMADAKSYIDQRLALIESAMLNNI